MNQEQEVPMEGEGELADQENKVVKDLLGQEGTQGPQDPLEKLDFRVQKGSQDQQESRD